LFHHLSILHNAHDDQKKPAALYVVATPIGNLRDITLRALDVLKSVSIIAAEDTRVTRHLLDHFGISSKSFALHEHNEEAAAQRLIAALAAGESAALVSDAGTPGVSDPGARAVAHVRKSGYAVVPIPGASAAITAFSAAGFSAPHFLFYGFLPARRGARNAALEALKALPYALVFYEAPHRIPETLASLTQILGGTRRAVLARELTKLFEQIHADTLEGLCQWIAEDANRVRGEFVLLVEGAPEQPDAGLDPDAQRVLALLLEELPLKRAVALGTKITGAARNVLYARALELRPNDE
jgi:16S rRNA (cytidine1402-2'-O)-methyltransferase